jgi:hypothetical protein
MEQTRGQVGSWGPAVSAATDALQLTGDTWPPKLPFAAPSDCECDAAPDAAV